MQLRLWWTSHRPPVGAQLRHGSTGHAPLLWQTLLQQGPEIKAHFSRY